MKITLQYIREKRDYYKKLKTDSIQLPELEKLAESNSQNLRTLLANVNAKVVERPFTPLIKTMAPNATVTSSMPFTAPEKHYIGLVYKVTEKFTGKVMKSYDEVDPKDYWKVDA